MNIASVLERSLVVVAFDDLDAVMLITLRQSSIDFCSPAATSRRELACNEKIRRDNCQWKSDGVYVYQHRGPIPV